jgi:hypothetical protein
MEELAMVALELRKEFLKKQGSGEQLAATYKRV